MTNKDDDDDDSRLRTRAVKILCGLFSPSGVNSSPLFITDGENNPNGILSDRLYYGTQTSSSACNYDSDD